MGETKIGDAADQIFFFQVRNGILRLEDNVIRELGTTQFGNLYVEISFIGLTLGLNLAL